MNHYHDDDCEWIHGQGECICGDAVMTDKGYITVPVDELLIPSTILTLIRRTIDLLEEHEQRSDDEDND